MVVPAYNEAESLPALLAELGPPLESLGQSYEIVLVDDGSTDGMPEVLAGLRRRYPALRVVRLRRNAGQSAALLAGFAAATWQRGVPVVAAVLAGAVVEQRLEAGRAGHVDHLDLVPAAVVAGEHALHVQDRRGVVAELDGGAAAAGLVLLPRLFTGSLGEPGSVADNLIGMLETNATRIAAALNG